MHKRGELWYNTGNEKAPRAVNAGAVRHDGVNVMATFIVPTPDSSDNLKRCPKCGELKPRTEFSRDTSKPDGRHSHCKACIHEYCAANREHRREYDRKYRAANAERAREYRAATAERKREYLRKYYAANREHMAEYKRTYRQTDAGKAARRAGNHNRRARKLAAGGTFTAADLVAIRAAQTDKHGQLRCWICGKPIKGTPHLDHFMPLDKGGPNSAGNLHYTHAKCNLEKAAKLPAEFGRLI